jgi:hypothetical protein
MILYNREQMQKSLIGRVRHARIYRGTARENLGKTTHEMLKNVSTVVEGPWMNSKKREDVLRTRKTLQDKARTIFENAATGYDAATIQALTGLYTIDILRQADDLGDATPIIFNERFDPDAPEMVNLMSYMPYIGKEEELKGASDTVPLIQHVLPEKYPVTLVIRGFGDKTTLRELVFNSFHKTENIIESAARILADEKNADSLKPILGATYGVAFSQEADSTGATYDLKLYNTLKNAVIKALGLYNYPAKRLNGELQHKIYLLVNPIDLINIQPIVNGALNVAGGLQQLAQAIPIDGIIPYSGGLNNGMPYGNETLVYPGVAQGMAYVFVKLETYGGYRIVKRNETMEIGEGDILGLTSEKRAWHRIRGMFNDWVLPKTGGSKNYGAVIKVELPDND